MNFQYRIGSKCGISLIQGRSKKRYILLLNCCKRKIPFVLQKGFDGLNEECIETIKSVFRRWAHLENPEIPIALHTNDCTQECLGNVVSCQGVHNVKWCI